MWYVKAQWCNSCVLQHLPRMKQWVPIMKHQCTNLQKWTLLDKQGEATRRCRRLVDIFTNELFCIIFYIPAPVGFPSSYTLQCRLGGPIFGLFCVPSFPFVLCQREFISLLCLLWGSWHRLSMGSIESVLVRLGVLFSFSFWSHSCVRTQCIVLLLLCIARPIHCLHD